MESDHFVGKVTQKALIHHEGKILLSRDVGFDIFELPGGRIHKEENPADALKREIKEELGIDVQVGEPFYVCTTKWGKERSPHYFIVFETSISNPEQTITVDGSEVEEAIWVSATELDNLPLYQECISAIKKFFSRRLVHAD